MTFSDLARSEEKQIIFLNSLVSFLYRFNLDGVDIDWRFPVADDFASLPGFIKNLKDALRSTGGRNGLSMTLPLSRRRLQHFDIAQIDKHVDFFNLLSYGMHGTPEDDDNAGNVLNAHTNLTEIDVALDMLWHARVEAYSLNLGLAFHARGFTLSNPSCNKAGCAFSSGSHPGPCSATTGLLMNTEIDQIIAEKNLEPHLDATAAVKTISWDDQWVAYDDKETLVLKAKYALNMCMSGLAITAVNHDTSNGSYGGALTTSISKVFAKRPRLVYNPDEWMGGSPPCFWTGSAGSCPAGFIPRDVQPLQDFFMNDTAATFCCHPEDLLWSNEIRRMSIPWMSIPWSEGLQVSTTSFHASPCLIWPIIKAAEPLTYWLVDHDGHLLTSLSFSRIPIDTAASAAIAVMKISLFVVVVWSNLISAWIWLLN
ncbi:hypothetical protein ANO11243_084530 [Dothideomycetidae sp. 11243]|nr:hypothetical protein ANO11243_084530 [fungal sp. No.11243]